MLKHYEIRTDLAIEANESVRLEKRTGELEQSGIKVEEVHVEGLDVDITKVIIETKNASKEIGKPVGTYITMEIPFMTEKDHAYGEELSELLAKQIEAVLDKGLAERSGMIIGLGNRAVTADSLGPKVLDRLLITRHILNLYGKHAYEVETPTISAMEPGVMAKTGMETSEMVVAVVKQIKPDFLLVIDALAARSTKRLYTTIQISDTGISPGSGVGNHRNAINEECMGIPVIAIGIPTVVDAATIARDACEKWWNEVCQQEDPFPKEVSNHFYELKNMYVTTKEIDEVIERISVTISEGINKALYGI